MNTSTCTSEAVVTGVNGSIVTMEAAEGSIMKNEVAYVCVGEQKLKAEVLRIRWSNRRFAGLRRDAGRKSWRSG